MARQIDKRSGGSPATTRRRGRGGVVSTSKASAIGAKRGYHHGDLKEALVSAALLLIDRVGPRGFSMSQACRLASVSPSALYRHFADKQSLLAEVARRGFDDFADAMARCLAARPTTAADRLLSLGEAYVDFALTRPAVFRAMFGAAIPKAEYPQLAAAAARAFGLLEAEVRASLGVRADDPDEVLTAAMALWSSAHGLAMLHIDGIEAADPAKKASRVRDILRAVVTGLPIPSLSHRNVVRK